MEGRCGHARTIVTITATVPHDGLDGVGIIAGRDVDVMDGRCASDARGVAVAAVIGATAALLRRRTSRIGLVRPDRRCCGCVDLLLRRSGSLSLPG